MERRSSKARGFQRTCNSKGGLQYSWRVEFESPGRLKGTIAGLREQVTRSEAAGQAAEAAKGDGQGHRGRYGISRDFSGSPRSLIRCTTEGGMQGPF